VKLCRNSILLWSPKQKNLTHLFEMILVCSDWNPHADLQAMARAHRLGQTNKVKTLTHSSHFAGFWAIRERERQTRLVKQRSSSFPD